MIKTKKQPLLLSGWNVFHGSLLEKTIGDKWCVKLLSYRNDGISGDFTPIHLIWTDNGKLTNTSYWKLWL